MKTHRKKALIAMSGGVDSSVAAALMQQQGYDCAGATMQFFSNDAMGCSSTQDIEDARAVCAQLGIEHVVFDAHDTFAKRVINPFVEAYLQGTTPNPCIQCNAHLKFGQFITEAKQRGFDCIATGHYARIDYDKLRNCYLLKTALDQQKDQSYVLYTLGQEQLEFVRFPLGDFSKNDVRSLACQLKLPVREKAESQDICFIPKGNYAAFIRQYCNEPRAMSGQADSNDAFSAALRPGYIVDEHDRVLGRHEGIINYTVGQRKGIGIGGSKALYVKEINAQENKIVVVPRAQLGATVAILDHAVVSACIKLSELPQPLPVYAKHRYRCVPRAGLLEQIADYRLKVTYHEPVADLTLGQSLVLYTSDTQDVVLAGGTIVSTRQ